MADTHSHLLERRVEPGSEPLSLAEAKLFLRVDGSSEDSLITDMIAAVREAAEEYLRKSLITQSWAVTYDDYAPACTPLPKGPVQSVESVKSLTRAGTETTVDSDIYHLNAARDRLHFDSIVMGHEVEIVYEAGYGDANDVPGAIRQGMLGHLAALYDNRIEGIKIPASSIELYKPHRQVRIA